MMFLGVPSVCVERERGIHCKGLARERQSCQQLDPLCEDQRVGRTYGGEEPINGCRMSPLLVLATEWLRRAIWLRISFSGEGSRGLFLFLSHLDLKVGCRAASRFVLITISLWLSDSHPVTAFTCNIGSECVDAATGPKKVGSV